MRERFYVCRESLPKQMCRGFEQVIVLVFELVNHGRHKVAGVHAEEALDVWVTEGQVGQSHHGVAANFRARIIHSSASVQATLDL